MAVVFPRQEYLSGISSGFSWAAGLCTDNKFSSSVSSLCCACTLVTPGGPAHGIVPRAHSAGLPWIPENVGQMGKSNLLVLPRLNF